MITLVRTQFPTDPFVATLRQLGETVQVMPNSWLLRAALAPGQILNALKPVLDESDRVLVIKTGNGAAGAGFEPDLRDWLNDAFPTTDTEQTEPVAPQDEAL